MVVIILLLLLIILFYFHLNTQFKKPREPFEIYETTYESHNQIDVLNSYKKPYLFEMKTLCPLTFTTSLDELNCFVSLIDISKYYNNPPDTDENDNILELPLRNCLSITAYLPNYSCSGIIQSFENNCWKTVLDECNDVLNTSYNVVSNKIGVMFGSKDSHSIPEYHTQTAKYLIVLSGEITVKLMTIRNCERLNGGEKAKQKNINSSNNCFTHFYFNKTNLWNKNNVKLNKIPFLDFNVSAGYTLSIPPFMVWSIMYNTPGTVVITIDYITFINSIANFGNWCYSQYYDYNNNREYDDDAVDDADDASTTSFNELDNFKEKNKPLTDNDKPFTKGGCVDGAGSDGSGVDGDGDSDGVGSDDDGDE